jgi:hypothetical protein
MNLQERVNENKLFFKDGENAEAPDLNSCRKTSYIIGSNSAKAVCRDE